MIIENTTDKTMGIKICELRVAMDFIKKLQIKGLVLFFIDEICYFNNVFTWILNSTGFVWAILGWISLL